MFSMSILHEHVQKLGARLLLSISLAAGCAPLYAQMPGQGVISGTITDPSGAAIANASVTATNDATKITIARTTTKDGYYYISPVAPGTYTINVTAPGFEAHAQQNVVVDALAVVGINVSLPVGSTTDTVTVSTAPPDLQTSTSTIGDTIENKTYSELPLQMGGAPRDPTAFAALANGIISGEGSGIFNGSHFNLNEMYLDGVPLTSIQQQGTSSVLNQNLSVDAVEQFQVQTSGETAQYQGSGFENYTVKSGTNSFHGLVSDYIRNTAFDTWNFFSKAVTIQTASGGTEIQPKPPEHQNEFSASLGGPIKKNKMFFFVNYDRYHYTYTSNPNLQTIPTTAARTGDFTAFPYPIYDPTTVATCTTANGGQTCAYQFMGMKGGVLTPNVIPQNEISPQAQAIQQFLPPVSNSALSNNYLYGYPQGRDIWGMTAHLDYQISGKQQISIISTTGIRTITPVNYAQTTVLPEPYTNGTGSRQPTTTDIVKDTYILTPHLVNQLRYGYSRYAATLTNPENGNPKYEVGSAIGIGNLPVGQASTTFPNVTFSGGVDAPSEEYSVAGSHEAANTYTASDDVNWLKGKHSITIGGDYQWLQFNESTADSPSTPLSLKFSNGSTSSYKAGTIQNSTTGLAYASFLIGAVDSTSLYIQNFTTLGARERAFSPYVQDDFKVTQRLTLNLGLRWDLYTPYHEVHDRISFLSPTLTNPATGNAGALLYGGSGAGSCDCGTQVKTWYKNFGPRLGFAYNIEPKTVIRGASNITYSHSGGVGGSNSGNYNGTGQVGLTASPAFSDSGQGGQPAFYLNSNFGNTSIPAYSSIPSSSASANTGNYISGGTAVTASSVTCADPYSGRPAYTENFNFGVQRAITRSITFNIDYVGSQSHFIPKPSRGYWENQLPPQYEVLGSLTKQLPGSVDTKTGMTYLQEAQAILPGIGLPYIGFAGSQATIGQMLKPFPQYSGVTDLWGDMANANYNSMQLSLKQREWHGLSYTLNYSFSKMIDDTYEFRSGYPIPGNVIDGGHTWAKANRVDRSVSIYSEPQKLTIYGVYGLPFGGRGEMGEHNAFTRALASGWKLSWIVTYNSGEPLAFSGTGCNTPGQCIPSYNSAHTGPVRIHGGYGKGLTVATASTTHYLDATAFVGTPGNAGYNFGDLSLTAAYGLWNPGTYNITGGVKRTFPIHEKDTFTFSAECFNATNHVDFGGIGTSFGSPTSIGEISKQENASRDWQFSGAIAF
jgi:hypothetical protein